MLLWIGIAAVVVALDQIAKFLVTTLLSETASVHVIPYLFDFVYVKNTGAAFSMFSKNTGLLSIISVLFCAGVIVYWYRKKPQHPMLKTSLSQTGLYESKRQSKFLYKYVNDMIYTSYLFCYQ